MAASYRKLTQTALKALPLGKRVSEHGIVAEKTKDGDIRWSVNVMVDGARIHRVIGRASEGVTRTQAENGVAALRTRAREERLSLPSARKTHRFFSEAATEYLERLEKSGGKNLAVKRRHIERMLIPQFGNERADRISALMVQDYVAARRRSVAQATVNRELATLSHALKRFAEWRWIKTDDVPRIIKGAESRKQIIVLDDDEAARLAKAAILDPDPRLWLFIAVGLNSAMRHSEILRIRYDHVDVASRRIFIPTAKAGEREQPITPSLVEMLKRQRKLDGEGADWLFPTFRPHAKEAYRRSVATPFRRTVERAGLSTGRVTPHVMRHTAITRLVKAGIDLPTIARISGHKTLLMVMRYVHLHGRHIDEALSALDASLPKSITQKLHTPESNTESLEGGSL